MAFVRIHVLQSNCNLLCDRMAYLLDHPLKSDKRFHMANLPDQLGIHSIMLAFVDIHTVNS